jgi:NAD(P)-dependent dehydrogenase (short-subunit alcohol dehydrogenase family)
MELGADRVAVVTGAASGIGLGLTEAYARTGMSVVLADVDEEALAAARWVSDLGVETLAVRTDVRAATEVQALAEAAVGRFGGRVDVVCNHAGVAASTDH